MLNMSYKLDNVGLVTLLHIIDSATEGIAAFDHTTVGWRRLAREPSEYPHNSYITHEYR